MSRPTFKVEKPSKSSKDDKQDNLWVKCEQCGSPLFEKIFLQNLRVCDKCGFHHKLFAQERMTMLVDPGTFEELDRELSPADPLNFGKEYMDKMKEDTAKTSLKDAILTGSATMGGHPVMLGIMDFHFRGGSMGSVVGEKIARIFEAAMEKRSAVITVTSSGGARMQEGVLALMQMAKTSALTVSLGKERLPYIVIITDPTTGGVSASFASLGDVIIAEPHAIIGFSGPRVIEQTIRQKLPPGFQSSEFYLKHGFIDCVVHRKDMRTTLIKVLNFFRERYRQ
ncbi:MAG: acetyl-CoA carboxylase, carboxyltransferase subunit beta [Candidatus Eremiobacteraeota bacterium]|nr:acetyl-CoA carboxylase, carboxyltransferase subunit beta [Candidatus Eremiobacteraeota bacterium]